MLSLPKNSVNIQTLVTVLEHPTSDQHIEELNIKLGKYLDKQIEDSVEQNLSFWETVTYKYWNILNLAKMGDLKYDANTDKFFKKVREYSADRMKSSPNITPVPSVENLTKVSPEKKTIQEKIGEIPKPIKYAALGVGIAVVAFVTFQCTQE